MEYGLIGEKLTHSFSKEIHQKIRDMIYELHPLSKEDFKSFMEQRSFKAINVTIPYKEMVIPYLDWIDSAALDIGAVNTIVSENKKLKGYNTDCYGVEYLLSSHNINVCGSTVAVLGSGGTSKTCSYVMKKHGAKQIYIVSRNKNEKSINYDELYSMEKEIDIIINTTPVGMYPNLGERPVDLSKFSKLRGVVDVIFNPLRTNLICQAKYLDIPCCGGLEMLVAQAVYANQIFFKESIDKEIIQQIYHDISKEKKNIVLIGMPTCGKTTIGKILSSQLNKKFYDIDAMIVEKCKMPISEIFRLYSEDYFRDAESEICQELSTAVNSVISCGGGVVKRIENMFSLGGNGDVFYIDREMSLLKSEPDRPLGNNIEKLKNLYNERYCLYRRYSDFQISNNSSLEDAVEKIKEKVR